MKGEKGDSGKDGINGKDGTNGSIGSDGTNGKDGTNGTNGSDGINGKDGTNGTNGSDGINGKNGSEILNGNGAPNLSIGKIGDYFFDKTNVLMYGPKAIYSWGDPVSLRSSSELGAKAIVYKDLQIIEPAGYQTDLSRPKKTLQI